MKGRKVILDTSFEMKELRKTVATMTKADVDIEALVTSVISSLSTKSLIEQEYEHYCSLYCRWGSDNNAITTDGAKLTQAWQLIHRSISKQYFRVGMWDIHGFCRYVFLGILPSDDVVIAITPDWEEDEE